MLHAAAISGRAVLGPFPLLVLSPQCLIAAHEGLPQEPRSAIDRHIAELHYEMRPSDASSTDVRRAAQQTAQARSPNRTVAASTKAESVKSYGTIPDCLR